MGSKILDIILIRLLFLGWIFWKIWDFSKLWWQYCKNMNDVANKAINDLKR